MTPYYVMKKSMILQGKGLGAKGKTEINLKDTKSNSYNFQEEEKDRKITKN